MIIQNIIKFIKAHYFNYVSSDSDTTCTRLRYDMYTKSPGPQSNPPGRTDIDLKKITQHIIPLVFCPRIGLEFGCFLPAGVIFLGEGS